MDFGEIGWGVDCVELALDKDQWKDVANKVMNLRMA
jgi:hypothetical protein